MRSFSAPASLVAASLALDSAATSLAAASFSTRLLALAEFSTAISSSWIFFVRTPSCAWPSLSLASRSASFAWLSWVSWVSFASVREYLANSSS